ncbi:putative secernin-2-like [Apostichopus japonicus]|uniref:Putative secernin-2-like n=1 Tax=Stichopus japonicus TaxID=307972 RepID=A0A2G8LQM4_STIJA|nr:putative secernin-2-like [Apostichopus japonicus]
MFELLRSPSLMMPNITGSMVCLLSPSDSKLPCFHFASGTPNPSKSVFKPFIFTATVNFPMHTVSPDFGPEDPVRTNPRFQKQVDRRHSLYKHHENFRKSQGSEGELMKTIFGMEKEVLTGVKEVLGGCEIVESDLTGFFNDCVETEIKFYL